MDELALQHMQNDPSIELHVCFKRSYDEVLRHHHTFFVRSLAAVRPSLLPFNMRLPNRSQHFRLLFGLHRIVMISILASRKAHPWTN